jgi:hypothetical protein
MKICCLKFHLNGFCTSFQPEYTNQYIIVISIYYDGFAHQKGSGTKIATSALGSADSGEAAKCAAARPPKGATNGFRQDLTTASLAR